MEPRYDILKHEEINALADEVVRAADGKVLADPASLSTLATTMARVAEAALETADEKGGESLRKRVVIETSLAVMWQVAATPPFKKALSRVFSELVIRELAVRNGYVFLFAPNDVNFGTLFDLLPANAEWSMADARPWMSSHLARIPDGSTPDVPLELPPTYDEIRAFIALPLTGRDGAALARLERHSTELAEVCSAYRINTFQPILYTHPLRHPGPAHDPAVHVSDFDRLAQCDLLIVILDAASYGVGKLVRHAESLLMPIVIFVGGSMVKNPMVHGGRANKTVFDLTSSNKHALDYYLNKSIEDLKRHRWVRLTRARWAPILRDLQSGMRRISKLQAEVASLLPVERVREICSSVDHLASASFEEVQALISSLAPHWTAAVSEPAASGLSDAEIAAAFDAASEGGWSRDALQRHLVVAAASPMSGAGRPLLTSAAWLSLVEEEGWPRSVA